MSQTKRFHNLIKPDKIKSCFEMLIIVAVKIEKLMSTHATRLAIRANGVANKTLLSAILNSKDCTLVYDVVDFINIRQTSIRIQQTQTKNNPLESGFKNMRFWRADSLDGPAGRWKVESYEKVCRFKRIRIRVDGGLI